MSYSINGVGIGIAPTGSIISYLGTSDPDGWIICDGGTRDNSNNIYDDLLELGVGTNSGTSYFPPDFTGRFMMGSTSPASEQGIKAGSNSHTLTTAQMPSHAHTGTTASEGEHVHKVITRQDDYNVSGGAGPSFGSDNGAHIPRHETSAAGEHNHGFTTNNTGGGSAFSIIPSHVTVNYIIKY
jgi:microcystin-dependent protein